MQYIFQPGAHIRVAGLASRRDLNGQEGVVVNYESSASRYKVILQNGFGVSLRPDNVNLVNQPAKSRNNVFKIGDRVSVVRIASRPELNGKEGFLHEWDDLNMRWKIIMNDGSGLSLPQVNLESLPVHRSEEEIVAATLSLKPGMRIRISGLRSRVELNGAIGRLLDFDESEKRWKVLLQDESGLSVRPHNLEPYAVDECHDSTSKVLMEGEWVRIIGLTSRPELNGCRGKLVEYDAVDQRWKIILSDSRGLKIRQQNLQLATPFDEASASEKHGTPHVQSEMLTGVAPKMSTSEDTEWVHVQPCVVDQALAPTPSPEPTRHQADNLRHRFQRFLEFGERICIPDEPTLRSHPGQADSDPSSQAQLASDHLHKDARVRIAGLRSKPELNGRCGTLLEFDHSLTRWKVILDDGRRFSLRNQNLFRGDSEKDLHSDSLTAVRGDMPLDLRLQPDTRVRIVNLRSRYDLNGSEGWLLEYDDEQHRWKVLLDDRSGKFVRAENLEALVVPPSTKLKVSSSDEEDWVHVIEASEQDQRLFVQVKPCNKTLRIGDVVCINAVGRLECIRGAAGPRDPSATVQSRDSEIAFLQCTWNHGAEERYSILSLDGTWGVDRKGTDLHLAMRKDKVSPDVSVLLMTSGRPQCLRAALDSLCSQEFPRSRFEVIVVDDGLGCPLGAGALDGLDESFIRECVRYVSLQQSAPLESKLNLAAFLSRGKVLMHWHEDAYYGPACINLQTLPVLNGEADFVFLAPTHVFYSSSAGNCVFCHGGHVQDNVFVAAFRCELWSFQDCDRQFTRNGTLACLSRDVLAARRASNAGQDYSSATARAKELDADALDFIYVERGEIKSLATQVQEAPPSFLSKSALWHLQHGLWYTGPLIKNGPAELLPK